ncbi:MAG: hypothetical protein WC539_00110 [Nitrospirota bacterium]
MYIIFLIIVTISLIATAAYFSVFGIASMFAYNYIPAMIMGITLEAGKIGVAVYLFKYWRPMTRLFKSLLITFLVALMFITSVGIFGFLSQGYQKTSEEFNVISLELKTLEDEYKSKKIRMEEINAQIVYLPSSAITNKIRLSREFSDEQAEIRDRLAVIEPRIHDLKVKRLAYESHIGPIAYVARMINAPQDNVVFFAIMVLVFVADPLAITLTIASNMALIHYWENTRTRTSQAARSPMGFENYLGRIWTTAVNAFRESARQRRVRIAAKKRIAAAVEAAKSKKKTVKRRTA